MNKAITGCVAFFAFVGAMTMGLSSCGGNSGDPQLGNDPVKKVIKAMTLEEKASLVVGTGMNLAGMFDGGNRGPARDANRNAPDAPGQSVPDAGTPNFGGPVVGETKAIVPGAAGTTYGIERLGILAVVVADGPAGLRINPTRPDDDASYYCTAFPVGTLLASTWDVDLVKSVGQAMGDEVKEYGSDVILGPALNIHRNPLCGRNFEYYSEDPLIVGKIGAAMVNGIESVGVGTSIKHYAVNNAETNRNNLNVIVSERALREIYLKGFEIIVKEAQPWTVMSSYNLINGTYAPESYDLITTILRDDFGFEGMVMSDWMGGRDAAAMVRSGNDLLMPGSSAQTQTIIDAVNDGSLDVADLDRNVARILDFVLRTPRFNGYDYSNKPALEENAKVTRQAATEGMILLKNDDNSLPFKSEVKKIATFGVTSFDIITGGTGSGDVNEAYSVSLEEGLQNAGYTTDKDLADSYHAYLAEENKKPRSRGMFMGSTPIPELVITKNIATKTANSSDAAIITIGRNSGEGSDRKAVEGDFYLNQTEMDMIKTVCDAFHAKGKEVVVILNIGGVIETASWKEYPDAILLAWQAGQETGNSIADILCGNANPSGKLPMTFPVTYNDVPSSKDFPGKTIDGSEIADGLMASFRNRVDSEDTYEEGIYVGYRYYNTFDVPVSYEFGYGLSYSSFSYSDLQLGASYSGLQLSSKELNDGITATVTVTNKGQVAGKEIVQLYVSAPDGNLDKPESELKGFAKTKLLEPGESQTLTFIIDNNSLASFDTASSSWVADAGEYKVSIGASCKNILLSDTFTLEKAITVAKVHKALSPKVEINELTSK